MSDSYEFATHRFPFGPPNLPFEEKGLERATNEVIVEERLSPVGLVSLLGTNLGYFLERIS